jgi:hypothetical protein
MPVTGHNKAIVWMAFATAALMPAADPPQDVVEFFRGVAQSLTDAHAQDSRLNNDPATFLSHFDSNMQGYAQLRAEIEDLVTRASVANEIEFVSDEGDENKRTLDVDWTLEIEGQRSRRAILKCTIERGSGKKSKWKITAIAPIEFFKY